MSFEYALRTKHLKPEGAYQVLAPAQTLEASGREIIHLEIGQSDFETSSNICLAGIRAISEGQTRYTPPIGMKTLRETL
jgi:aspartate aminotransferase